MKLIIQFLQFISISTLIVAQSPDEIQKDILETIEREKNIHPNAVNFHDGGLLSKTPFSLVWKGDYNGRMVAYKLTAIKYVYETEIDIFAALNAINNREVEKFGIPNAYVHGNKIKYPYWAIGMTLFEENLKERCDIRKGKISELSILLIFKRVVQILKYLNERKVIHNDIKPANIFFRGSEVFLGGFIFSAKDGVEFANGGNGGCTPLFASSGWYSNKTRTPMDDFESLVFSLWFVAGIERDKVKWLSEERIPEGKTLVTCKEKGTAKSKMTKKCEKFQNKHVQKAFMLIAADEMLKNKHAPDYKLIVNILDEAIKNVHKGKSGPPQFEWLTGQSSQIVRIRDILAADKSS